MTDVSPPGSPREAKAPAEPVLTDPGGTETPTWRAFAFANLPWLVLVLVATIQILISTNTSLSSWKGGGFGMFASHVDRRVELHVVGVDGRGEVFDEQPKGRASMVRAARNFPSERNLQKLLADSRKQLKTRGVRVRSIRVEVWEITYDPSSSTLNREWLRTVHANLDNGVNGR